MTKNLFSVEKNNNTISLYAIDMINLNKGDIFFRRNDDGSIDTLQKYDENKNYINSIIDNFLDSQDYNEEILFQN